MLQDARVDHSADGNGALVESAVCIGRRVTAAGFVRPNPKASIIVAAATLKCRSLWYLGTSVDVGGPAESIILLRILDSAAPALVEDCSGPYKSIPSLIGCGRRNVVNNTWS